MFPKFISSFLYLSDTRDREQDPIDKGPYEASGREALCLSTDFNTSFVDPTIQPSISLWLIYSLLVPDSAKAQGREGERRSQA